MQATVSLTGIMLIAGMHAAPALGQTMFAPGLFDKPASVQTVANPKEPSIQARCTYYADFMIRSITDGPTSQKASLIRGAKPPCGEGKVPGELTLDTDDMTLDGRKGAALFFSAMDPHGAVPFVVIDARSGKIVLKDATTSAPGPGIQMIAIEPDGLRLRYRRAFNAPCSILQNAAGCWARIVKEGLVPKDMAQPAPAAQICDAAYRKMKAPRDNPSIVIYQTEVSLVGAATRTLSRGPIGCDSLP